MQKKPNRLINETSPYLLQHAYNPVDWYPWGKEAFEKAKKEDKMIFLSIGYSTCHWCHVMEKESFENEEIAQILNEFFVPIKVDREELPDVDHIYMNAITLMGIQGGWPLNVFLTPDLKPITGGTYFPPIRKWGMPSFKEILLRMIQLWHTEKENIIKLSEDITQQLQQIPKMQSIEIKYETFHLIVDYFYKFFDRNKGGFLINGKNKFPPSMNLFLLLQIYRKNQNPLILEMIEKTLREMRYGGIYDQIGGGISRYSTDHQWLIPHFEKMLYDNALFCSVNLETYKITKNPFYLKTAIDVLDYLLRDMKNENGGFYSAEDADSDGEEGKFYLWTKEEFTDVLKKYFTKKEIEELVHYFGLTEQGNFESKNVLSINPNISLQDTLITKARKLLLEHRNKRNRPHRDEKILTSWNALVISALSYAYLATLNNDYLNEAELTLNFILDHLTINKAFDSIPEEGLFYRSYSNHKKKNAPYIGTLTDHAAMGCAFLDLFKSTGKIEYLHRSNQIKNYILKYHYQDGILYETRENDNELIIRPADFYDGVLPSGLSLTFRLLTHLYFFGIENENCENILNSLLNTYLEKALQYPFSYSYFLMSVFKLYFLNQQIVVSTKNKDKIKEILSYFGKEISSETIFALFSNNSQNQIENILLLKDKSISENHPYTIYICENFSCQLPISNLEQLTQTKIF